MNVIKVGKVVRRMAMSGGFTPSKLSRESGVSYPTASDFLKGKRRPQKRTIEKLTHFFKIEVGKPRKRRASKQSENRLNRRQQAWVKAQLAQIRASAS